MASHDISPRYEYHLQIYGCTEAKNCVLLNTGSCPMNQKVVVRSGLAPRRIHPDEIDEQIDSKDVKPFRKALQRVGLIRRITKRPEQDTLALNMAYGTENDQFQCDKVGGERGNVYVRSI